MPRHRESYVRSFTLDSVPTRNSRGEIQHIQRFDGINKKNEKWDHLRRDAELWWEDGDCLVHLYAASDSQRGPSLRIPLSIIHATNSRFLLQQCQRKVDANTASTSEDDSSDSGYSGSANGITTYCAEVHVPSPVYTTRSEAHAFHLATRNVFAFLCNVPLVGATLGLALTELWRRIKLWQIDDSAGLKFHTYCREQGYLNYLESPQYAAASLYFVEQTRLRVLWPEAFAHCVGMHDRIAHFEDYVQLSEETRDLVAQSARDMKAHVIQVTQSLGTFLEEDLGPEHLGLSKPLRDHLDRFRSALHLFYVHEINGYFPPDENDPWGKRFWRAMYGDFHHLYAYLADTKSTEDHTSNVGSQGGICVAQNLEAFNSRHGLVPLPYTWPLLPVIPQRAQGWNFDARMGLGSFRKSQMRANDTPKLSTEQALLKASNHADSDVMRNRLVQEYVRFESVKVEEKIPPAEARKIRWLLVYSVLQLLISITKPPAEIHENSGASYPLCVRDTTCPKWPEDQLTVPGVEDHAAQYLAAVEAVRKSFEEDKISIHPDCEASCAADYFSMTTFSRSDSGKSSSTAARDSSPPMRRASTLSRSASIRSSVSTLHRSVVGSLARRTSSRRNSIMAPATKSPTTGTFCDTVHELHGSEVEEKSPVDSVVVVEQIFAEEEPALFSQSPRSSTDAPALEMHQLSLGSSPLPLRKLRHTIAPKRHRRVKSRSAPIPRGSVHVHEPVDNNVKMDLPQQLASDLSSFAGFDFDLPPQSPTSTTTTEEPEIQKLVASPTFHHETTPGKWANINTGCYLPTGIGLTALTHTNISSSSSASPPTSLPPFRSRNASLASNASSIYPEHSTQADDIAEHDPRGRCRVRSLSSTAAASHGHTVVGLEQRSNFPSISVN